jgi:hypothetical protein
VGDQRDVSTAYSLEVPLHRAILLTPDEVDELRNLHRTFHVRRNELEALQRLTAAQTRIAIAHGLDPAVCAWGYEAPDSATWTVRAHYPLSLEEEREVRGLG